MAERVESKVAERHPHGLGWVMPDGRYVCDGCTVLGVHEHRCYGPDGGAPCECEVCRELSPEELAAFMQEIGC